MQIRIVDTIQELKDYLGFTHDGVILEDSHNLDVVENDTDLFERKRRDAEVLTYLAANNAGKFIEIGTSYGHSTFRLATNIRDKGTVYTVNLLPEQATQEERLVTHFLTKEEIGSFYRKHGLRNIEQIYANTLTWDVPKEISDLSLVFVDGCHDTEFVYSDTRKLYPRVKEGGYIMWHDFSPIFRRKFGWIDEVMLGVEKFFAEMKLEGEIVHLRNSWIGVYRKPPKRVVVTERAASEKQAGLKQFLFPERMKSLRYLMAYTAHDLARQEEEEGYIARLREMGYDVEGFCVSVPGPGHHHWFFDRLDHEYRNSNPHLMGMYSRLADRLREKDVFILWTGAMVHPDFVATLSTYNVYVCSDDPDSSDHLSRPVAPSFDYAFTRNVACPDMYRSWGCRNVKWLSPPVSGDLLFTGLTEDQILTGRRDLDLVMFCERIYQGSDRAQRIEKLISAFPQTFVRGKGWPGGFCSKEEMADAYRRARIGWNLHNSIGPTNSRLMTLPAFGILQICDNKQNLAKIYELDKEVVGFDTVEECIEKTRYYLAHEDERRQIAAAGWKRAMSDYTEERQWERLLAAISENCLRKLGLEKPAGAPGVLRQERPLRLNLGSGSDYREGYVNVDLTTEHKTDICMDYTKVGEIFQPGSVDEILMYHSINYLNLWQARDFFRTALNLLAPEGRLIIETINLENAIAHIAKNVGRDFAGYLEGVRAVNGFGLDHIEGRKTYFPTCFSWTAWHMQAELLDAGFADIAQTPQQSRSPWRDMRIEAVKPATEERPKGKILFLIDPALGHVTAHLRGTLFAKCFAKNNWVADFVDVRSASEDDIVEASKAYDLVYLLKIASLSLVRKLKEKSSAKVLFDLTDALWKEFHRKHGWWDLEKILMEVDALFSENEFICSFGRRFSENVYSIPACTQVEKFDLLRHKVSPPADRTVIGWIGSNGTTTALHAILEPLETLFGRHPNLELRIVGCSDTSLLPPFKNIRYTVVPSYDEDDMIREVLGFHIGIFPPPLDLEDFAIRGALKAMIYMSGGRPAVTQNGGDCSKVIRDGENGFLADTAAEWLEKLDALVSSPALREKMGKQALLDIRREHSIDYVFSEMEKALLDVIAPARAEEAPAEKLAVAMFYDQEGWAWWNRANEVRKYVGTDIDVRLLRLGTPFNAGDFDLVVVFDPYLYDLVRHVPKEKIIIGCSCPKFLDQTRYLLENDLCGAILVNNAAMYEELGRHEKVFCCQNGVDTSLFYPAPTPVLEPVGCWVGNSGSEGNKGLDLISAACEQAGVKLVILDKEATKDRDTLYTRERVRDEIYQKASFYLCASEWEGTPNPALEALACGLPVISTKVGNMTELLMNGYNGFLVDRSVEAIREAIEKLKVSDRRDLSRNARLSMEKLWTWQSQSGKYEKMFRTVAGKSREIARGLNEKGELLFAKGREVEAEQTFLEAAAVARSPEALNNLGVLYWNRGDRGNAIIYLNEALKIDPSDKAALANSKAILGA